MFKFTNDVMPEASLLIVQKLSIVHMVMPRYPGALVLYNNLTELWPILLYNHHLKHRAL